MLPRVLAVAALPLSFALKEDGPALPSFPGPVASLRAPGRHSMALPLSSPMPSRFLSHQPDHVLVVTVNWELTQVSSPYSLHPGVRALAPAPAFPHAAALLRV